MLHQEPFNRDRMSNLLFVLPAFLVFTAIVVYPLANSFRYSFTDWNMRGQEYSLVGFDNYKTLFQNDLVRAGIKNTLLFTVYTTFVANSIALLLALVLDKNLRSKVLLRAVFYIPCLLSPIVISAIFSQILQYRGLLNEVFRTLGFDALVNDWFGNVATAMPMLIGLNTWQWAGFGSVIYLAGLQTIPRELYEAADMDGARPLAVFRHITVRLLMPSITVMSFLSITGGLKYFEIPFVLTNGGPGTATETVSTVIYRMAFRYERFGVATAISVVFLAFVMILSVAQVRFTRRLEVQL